MPPGENISPGVISVNPPSPTPSSQITINVPLNGSASGSQTFTISSSPDGSFSSIPSSNTPQQGATSFEFNATLSDGASGTVTITIASGTLQSQQQFTVFG